MKESSDKLSIVIPTYNREKELFRLLTSINNAEDNNKLYEVLIIDNNSNYDLKEQIKKTNLNYSVRLINNHFNVGMSSNLLNCFYHCKTNWIWTISDDDVIDCNAITTIIKDINEEKDPDICLLKYSTIGTKQIGKEKDLKVENNEELLDYYLKSRPIRSGNLVFFSNNVFNLKNLKNYLIKGYEFSYTYIPFLIPVFFALKNGKKVRFRKTEIIKYQHPGDLFWSLNKIGLGLSTINHLQLDLTTDYKKKFLRVVMSINFKTMFLDLLHQDNNNRAKMYNFFYRIIYKDFLSIQEKIIFRLLLFCLIFPNFSKKMISYLKRIKN